MAGPVPDCSCRFGETALHKAARMLHADETRARQVLELLLSRGANPWIAGNSGTCLNVLSNKKLAPILQKLIETHSSMLVLTSSRCPLCVCRISLLSRQRS